MAFGGDYVAEVTGGLADVNLAVTPSSQDNERPTDYTWDKGHKFRMENLLETGFLSDIVLEVGHQKRPVKAHRLILQAGSPEMYKKINKLEKGDKVVLSVPNVDYDSFILFLKFLYTGETGSNLEGLTFLPLLQIATTFGVTTLINICANKAERSLSEENAIPIYQQAMQCGQKELINSSLIFICQHAWKIVESEGFVELRQECLYELLTKDDLQVESELQLFQAVLRWANAECTRGGLEPGNWDNIRVALSKVIGLIRFPVMDQAEFTLNVALNNILGLEELVKILLYFTVPPSQREKIPPGRFISTPRHYHKGQNKPSHSDDFETSHARKMSLDDVEFTRSPSDEWNRPTNVENHPSPSLEVIKPPPAEDKTSKKSGKKGVRLFDL